MQFQLKKMYIFKWIQNFQSNNSSSFEDSKMQIKKFTRFEKSKIKKQIFYFFQIAKIHIFIRIIQFYNQHIFKIYLYFQPNLQYENKKLPNCPNSMIKKIWIKKYIPIEKNWKKLYLKKLKTQHCYTNIYLFVCFLVF